MLKFFKKIREKIKKDRDERQNWQPKRAVDEFWMIWYSNTGDEYGNAKQKAKQVNRV